MQSSRARLGQGQTSAWKRHAHADCTYTLHNVLHPAPPGGSVDGNTVSLQSQHATSGVKPVPI